MYSDNVINKFVKAKNVGQIKGASGIATVYGSSCGDMIKLSVKIENDKIVNAKFKAFGNVALISTMDTATDMIKEKFVDEAKNISSSDILNEVGDLPDDKQYCPILAYDAIQEVLKDYNKKKDKPKKSKQTNKNSYNKQKNIKDNNEKINNYKTSNNENNDIVDNENSYLVDNKNENDVKSNNLALDVSYNQNDIQEVDLIANQIKNQQASYSIKKTQIVHTKTTKIITKTSSKVKE